MSDCDKYIEMISSMVDGELSDDQKSELHTHLETCEACRKVFNAFAGISDILSNDLEEPPEMLAKGVMYKINLKKKGIFGGRFGGFTAIAACLAVILLGAAHYGLLGGNTARLSASAPMTTTTPAVVSSIPEYSLSAPSEAPEISSEPTPAVTKKGSTSKVSGSAQASLASGKGDSTSSPKVESTDTYQYGFPVQKDMRFMANAGDNFSVSKAAVSGEPECLFEAKEISAFTGRYSGKANSTDDKLISDIYSKEGLATLTGLIEADNAEEYTNVDTEFTTSEPTYTFFVEANKDTDANAKDELITAWFVNGETWCVCSDTDPADAGTEKIMYKAVGSEDKLISFVSSLKTK